jgi:hypothetical protein
VKKFHSTLESLTTEVGLRSSRHQTFRLKSKPLSCHRLPLRMPHRRLPGMQAGPDSWESRASQRATHLSALLEQPICRALELCLGGSQDIVPRTAPNTVYPSMSSTTRPLRPAPPFHHILPCTSAPPPPPSRCSLCTFPNQAAVYRVCRLNDRSDSHSTPQQKVVRPCKIETALAQRLPEGNAAIAQRIGLSPVNCGPFIVHIVRALLLLTTTCGESVTCR